MKFSRNLLIQLQLLGVVAAFLVAFPVLAFDPGDTKPLPPNVLKIKDLGQKTYAKEGLLHLEKVHQKIQVPEVIWSSDENVFEKDKEVARKRTQAILEADTVHPELRRIHKIMKPRIYKLNDRVYELYGFEMTMTTIVVGDTGLIIVDTNYGNEIGEMVFSIWREATGNQMPVHTVIYTHHHPDQCSGTAAYVDPDDVDAGKVNIIAHEDFFTNFIRESGYASPIMGHRALWAFGPLLPVGPEGYVSQGIGFVLPHLWVNRTSYTAKPTITIADHRTLEIDGVIMEFMHVPGESADHIAMYMPETETLLVGDSIQGETVPNMYTIRGAPYRDGEEWRRSIDRMRTYHAKDFTNHHGRPVTGREYVESVLLTWRDAIQYMNDQALRHINAGYTRDEVAERVVLPETLANHEYLRPLRGSADQNVRNIYNGYLGWYMGDPTERARPDFGRRAELYVEQMGGRDKILRSAQKALNDKDYGWTMDLTTWLIRHDPKDQEARNLKAKAMRQWGFQQPEPGWRNWALTGAWELENGSIPMKETLALSVDTMDEMPLLDLFKILRVGLNSEDIKTETHLIGLEIDGEAFIFGVRNGNLISDRGAPTWDTSMAKMTRPEFYDVFFFNSANGTRIDNDVVEKVVARLESPFGNKVPVVPR